VDVLLDTHTVLWFSENDPQLSKTAKSLIEKADNRCFVSVASLWEIAIKVSLKKLHLTIDLEELTNELLTHGFDLLPIMHLHAISVSTLEFIHKDPFDRLLVAQSKIERVPIVSRDKIFDEYKIRRIW